MAETVRSELPNLWRSMNEPRACWHLYQMCPHPKGRFKGVAVLRAFVDRCERASHVIFRLGTKLAATRRPDVPELRIKLTYGAHPPPIRAHDPIRILHPSG